MSNSFSQIDGLPYGQRRNQTAAVKQPQWSQEAEERLSEDLLLAEVLLFITAYRRLKECAWLKWDGHPLSFFLSLSQFDFSSILIRPGDSANCDWQASESHTHTYKPCLKCFSCFFFILLADKSDFFGLLTDSSLHEIISTPNTWFRSSLIS